MTLTGAPAIAGWYQSPGHAYDLQWWDGKTWAEAYWPHSYQGADYLPGSRRWDISTNWEPNVDIVGENWHEEAIARVIGRRPQRDVQVEEYRTAELIPEPDNPHDRNAICVRIQGRTVGYIPAELASTWVPLVHSIVAGNVVSTVRARIWAVTRYSRQAGKDVLKAAVRLALPAPDEVLPGNQPPNVPHALIPVGRSIQVTGEQDHYNVLAGYIGAKSLIVTLHPLEVQKARSTSTVLEVRIADERVGQLTPATSAQLMPLVLEAEKRGLVTAAWAKIQGSRLAAELSLSVAKAEQIPDRWPSADDTIPAILPVQPVPAAYIPTDPIAAPPTPGFLFKKRPPKGARSRPSH